MVRLHVTFSASPASVVTNYRDVDIFGVISSTDDLRDIHSFPTRRSSDLVAHGAGRARLGTDPRRESDRCPGERSEEHTSELQSHSDLVCRLRLEKKNMAVDIHDHLVDMLNVCATVVSNSLIDTF